MKICIVAFLICIGLTSAAIANPSEDEVRQWVAGKEVVVEQRWYWFDKAVSLRAYAMADVKIVKCEEVLKLKPWEQNIGTAVVHFNYRDGQLVVPVEAILTYTYTMIPSQRKLESSIIKRRF